jgi:hypothetical protein
LSRCDASRERPRFLLLAVGPGIEDMQLRVGNVVNGGDARHDGRWFEVGRGKRWRWTDVVTSMLATSVRRANVAVQWERAWWPWRKEKRTTSR